MCRRLGSVGGERQGEVLLTDGSLAPFRLMFSVSFSFRLSFVLLCSHISVRWFAFAFPLAVWRWNGRGA